MARRRSAAATIANLASGHTSAAKGSSSAQRYTDHSSCLDNANSKHTPQKSPDVKHKTTKKSSRIDGWCHRSWVLEKMETANKAQQLQERSGWDMLSLEEALASLERMPHPPSVENLACILRKCRKEKNPAFALRLHAYMRKNGLETHRFLGNYLVPMLVEVGSMCDAQRVFDTLIDRNEYSWTSLITGYIERGNLQHAFVVYQKMQENSVQPSGHTFVAILKACARLRDIEKGRKLHAEIVRKGLLEINPFICSTLVDMYAKCGLLAKAQEVFDKLPNRETVSWNALIAGYAEHGLGLEALNCFEQMQLEGFSPDAVTFVSSLKACQTLPVLLQAREVFDKLPVRDAVSWNALIATYAEHGLGQEALNCFEQMQLEGVYTDAITFVCSLKACGSIRAIDKGQEIHGQIVKNGLLESDPFVGSILVDMYAKCGLLAKAQEVFDNLPVRDVVLWNTLITGYGEHGLGEQSLNCFDQMQLEGISPDAITFVCSLKSCGSIGAIEKGLEIHAHVGGKQMLEGNPFIGSTLVDMYAKCGWLAKAQEVFYKLPVRDAVSWTALIAGYADLGESDNVFLMLGRMRAEGINPDAVTFLSILTVCSHTGLVDEGQTYFEAMSKNYGIYPTIEHHTCVVDLLGRAGQLDKAVMMIKMMPFNPNLDLWHTVLGACRKWGNVELGRWAFEHAVQLDAKDAAAYILMFNIYADAHMQEDAKQVQVMRLKEQVQKKPGQCWWNGTVHSLLEGDTGQSQSNHITAELEDHYFKLRKDMYQFALAVPGHL